MLHLERVSLYVTQSSTTSLKTQSNEYFVLRETPTKICWKSIWKSELCEWRPAKRGVPNDARGAYSYMRTIKRARNRIIGPSLITARYSLIHARVLISRSWFWQLWPCDQRRKPWGDGGDTSPQNLEWGTPMYNVPRFWHFLCIFPLLRNRKKKQK